MGSWWAENLRAAAPGYRRLWDILTVGFLAYAALDLLFLAESFIAAVIHLLLFLVVYKLYNTRSHRDILDLFILTFLELGLRRPPPIKFLPRSFFLNKWIGRLTWWLQQRRRPRALPEPM